MIERLLVANRGEIAVRRRPELFTGRAAGTDPAHPLLTPFAGRRLASRRGGVIA